jgi:two-component system response regulator AdeR
VPTVLIVEDTIELAEVIQATLERMNIDTHHESHGEKGMRTYEKLSPDLVLLDIALPDMQGWKLLDRIREFVESKPNREMPKIIVISAYGDPANRLMGKLQDIAQYLIKPFTPDEVEAVVAGVLGLERPS